MMAFKHLLGPKRAMTPPEPRCCSFPKTVKMPVSVTSSVVVCCLVLKGSCVSYRSLVLTERTGSLPVPIASCKSSAMVPVFCSFLFSTVVASFRPIRLPGRCLTTTLGGWFRSVAGSAQEEATF